MLAKMRAGGQVRGFCLKMGLGEDLEVGWGQQVMVVEEERSLLPRAQLASSSTLACCTRVSL